MADVWFSTVGCLSQLHEKHEQSPKLYNPAYVPDPYCSTSSRLMKSTPELHPRMHAMGSHAEPAPPGQKPRRANWRHVLVQWDISPSAIPLAVSAFTVMWKAVYKHYILNVPSAAYIFFWCIALSMLVLTLLLYTLRISVWPGSILWDFRNPRLVNFFFIPVIVGSLLIVGAPDFVMDAACLKVAFYVLTTYQVALSVYIYGEWLFGSALIDVVHPLMFLQIMGWFSLGNIAASLMLIEESRALISIGLLFWGVIFVTNFQHMSTAISQRSEKTAPTFCLFIAAPAQAAISVARFSAARAGTLGKDGLMVPPSDFVRPAEANVTLYVDLFVYLIIIRVHPTFWTQNFAIAWWAYIFPLSAAAAASMSRCCQTGSLFWPILSGLLVFIASIALSIVAISTVWGVSA